MDHWNKGGLSREEFLRMRENALRQLQELAKKQQAFANVDKAPAQNSNVMKNSSENAGRAGNRGKSFRIYNRDPLPFAARRIPSSAVALGT